jgi:hypothetical protein
MSTPYFYGLNTFPTFLVQSVDVTFSGQNKVYMVCTGLHPDALRCIFSLIFNFKEVSGFQLIKLSFAHHNLLH